MANEDIRFASKGQLVTGISSQERVAKAAECPKIGVIKRVMKEFGIG
jgi:hypothetical protein